MWGTEFVVGAFRVFIFSALTVIRPCHAGYTDLDLSASDLNPVDLKDDTISTRMCPKVYPILRRYLPRRKENAGNYEHKAEIHNIGECLDACCLDKKCNVVFMHETKCFNVQCFSNYDCLPVFTPEQKFENTRMILVAPVGTEDWSDSFHAAATEDEYSAKDDEVPILSPNYFVPGRACEIGVAMSCGKNEICESITGASSRSRSGVCQCKENYYRNETGFCVSKLGEQSALNIDLGESSFSQTTKQSSEAEQTSSKPIKPLVVSVVSKVVRLPENEVTLSAYTVPSEQKGQHFTFSWNLLGQPEGASTVVKTEHTGGTLKLSHLIEGIYKFKVTVTDPGTNSFGETVTNVTVLPQNRINKPPVVIITPSSQTIKLPNTVAVLDGSPSYDDDKIISWHWELQSGPLNYQPVLGDSLTLQLKDLVIPGNYTFKLTVEDSNHVTNSTTGNITVVKETDYPPEANAGNDVIVYLPANNITLNGSMSADDRGIVSWEWTKSRSDQDKAVDMQNTRTPYLELSNLEEGIYTFVLKVTDSSGQSSSSEVHVFVKPPTNKPPIANAGVDHVVSLPRTWVQLDASGSTDDIKIQSYTWQQLSGPNKAVLIPFNASKSNATELTKGKYEFQVTVVDSNGNSASDSVMVTVNQNENAAPKANAGGDQTIILPMSLVTLNGSSSSDDWAIKKWEWTREASSLALGRIIGDSDKTPVLQLTDLIPGRYVFKLKVSDGQGLSGEDTVSIIVKPDPYLMQLVELTLNIEGSALTVSQEKSLEAKLALLLRNAVIHVRELRREPNTGRAILVFYVGKQGDKSVWPGPQVVKLLKQKLQQDSSLLELSMANIQTAVCQNNCSGHGTCDQSTRQCLCEAFWMQNLVREYFGDGDSNCDWSILYVIIVLFTGLFVTAGCSWGLICLIQKPFHRPRKRQRYSLIDDGEEATMRVLNKSVMVSESESDSDVLFNARDKSGQDVRNGKRVRNGFVKLGKRIKT
ncbi:hypothetical protein RUM43_003420 [Polyplax serrata]|uniref:PKD/Chitinase domain-containing protein n=1 Tax=Polyplax serrata TaxID=468196 RepID=A0AAN8RX00_POLSC